MANKRMFSKEIVGSDAFLDMPTSSQLLYFHLGMEADDDGFIGNPKKVSRFIGASDDDLKILLTKKFVLLFKSGVVVIKHHRMNNNWDKYNCKRTVYLEEFGQLYIKENRAYTLDRMQGLPTQSENSLKTVFRIEENRRDKKRIEENTREVVAIATPTPKEQSLRFFEMVKSNSKEFEDYLLNFKGSAELAKKEIQKFTLYWTELNSTGTKQRWEKEKTFEVKKRLATWLSKVGNFKGQQSNNKYQATSV